MVTRMARIVMGTSIAAVALAFASTASMGAESIMKTCGAEWQAAKAGGKVQPGTTWPKFLSECRTRHANDATAPAAPAATATAPAPAPAPAAPAKPPASAAATPPAPATPPASAPAAPTPPATSATATPAKPSKPGRDAMVARERQCGARWKEIKGTSQLPAGITTWPKYWSWCNTQLKNGQAI